MQLDQTSIFRRTAVPWYDSTAVCIFLAGLLLLVILFGIAGIRAAAIHPLSHRFIWMPAILISLSTGLFISVIIRLVRRKVRRY